MNSEDGELFVKQLATFVRTHEKALANALQFRRQSTIRHGSSQSVASLSTVALSTSPNTPPEMPLTPTTTSSTLAAALSLGSLSFNSQTVKSAKLALTPHHLFYLLSRFEELGIPVGPMTIRLENLHDSTNLANYVSFLSQSQHSKTRGSDVGSIHSVSSLRSVMSGMSALWASFGFGSNISAARTERQKAAAQADLKYLYSAFTKIPCLKLAPDWRARLIRGYEEFPFDSAVPLHVFKNVQALEVSDIDFRQFFGWDRMADQIRSLTLRRASVEDPADILIDIVLDDMDKRRRRTSKTPISPTTQWPGSSSPRRGSILGHAEFDKSISAPSSPRPGNSTIDLRIGSLNSELGAELSRPTDLNARRPSFNRAQSDGPNSPVEQSRPRSNSPRRPESSRNNSTNLRSPRKVKRSGSGSSHSSLSDSWHNVRGSSSTILASILPASKWRFLKHLSLTDNSLTSIPAASLSPLANTLHSLDLSSNLFTQIPDSLSTLTSLRALNLSNCMVDSLHSLARSPLPAISALNLRANRLQSIAGIERLLPLERLDLRDNRLTDPMELARLTGIPEIREVWVDGNPFTRTHRDYRITIFNLFRKTPGYTDDISINASGPTYSEKKYLVERVAEPLAVPVIKPPVLEMAAVDVSKPAIVYDSPREPTVLWKERPAPKTASSEVNTTSTRRRRAPKRRIVDLATNDLQVTSSRPSDEPTVQDRNPRGTPQETYSIVSHPEIPSVPSFAVRQLSHSQHGSETPRSGPVISQQGSTGPTQGNDEQPMWKDTENWDAGGELYRRKIEALRDSMGHGYLTVLNEEGWQQPHHTPDYSDTNFDMTPSIRSNPRSPHPPNAQPLHSGRTLG